MNLKEAFQAQNDLKHILEHIDNYLSEEENTMTITEKHLKGKVAADQVDERIDVSQKSEENYDIEQLLFATEKLIEEKEKLALAISKAKASMDFNLDVAVDTNKVRHSFIDTLNKLAIKKNVHLLLKGSGEGYVFNKDGNQTSYHYDIDRIYTIDYDRNKVKKLLKKMREKADATSIEIDNALLNTTVDIKLDIDLKGEVRLATEELLLTLSKKK